MREGKKIKDFSPRDMESCHLAATRRVKLVAKCELVL